MRQTGVFVLAALTAVLISAELGLTLPIRGVGPDLLVMVLVAFVSGLQPRWAALAGFGAGLFRDLLLSTPAGLSAFSYAVTAYGVALVGPLRGVWAFVGLVAGATFASQAIYGIGTVLVAQDVEAAPLPRVIVFTTLYDALLAPLLLPVLRRIAPAEGSSGQAERASSA